MFTTIRKHQRWLMTFIAILTVIAFAWLYNTTDLERVGTNIVAKIYGRDVMVVDVERALRNYQLALALGQFELVRDLSGAAQTEDQAAENFLWNLMILEHEAKRLGVEPAQAMVLDRIKGLSVFQTDGQFDPVKYASFLQDQLAPRGFTERQLESVIGDTLRLQGVRQLVQSPAIVPPASVGPALERLAPMDVAVLRFTAADLAKDVAVSDEELEQAFAVRQEGLRAPERRSLRYTALVLSPDERDLTGRERVVALQRVASATGDLSQALSEEGLSLEEAVAARGLELQTTPLFAADGSTFGALVDLDGEVVPTAAAMAFRLPPEPGQFEIIELGNEGYAVVEVAEVQEARPLTFEEARADLRAELIETKRDAAVREAAEKTLADIRAGMAASQSFAEAAEAAQAKVENIEGLSPFDEDLTSEQRELVGVSMDQPAGTLGDFLPGPLGGFAVHVSARHAPDPETLAEQRPMIEQGLRQGEEMLLFVQWLTTAREAADLQILRPMM